MNLRLTHAPPEAFRVGQKVRKITGDYCLNGIVIGVVLTSRNQVRYVVEHKPGFLHIYSEKNLKAIVTKPKKEIVYG